MKTRIIYMFTPNALLLIATIGLVSQAAGQINVGAGNTFGASATYSSIAAGYYNSVRSPYSIISAGYFNEIEYSTSGSSVIGGGVSNFIGTNSSIWNGYSVIGGGYDNQLFSQAGIIGGGYGNEMGPDAHSGVIGGGFYNVCYGYMSTIGGGYANFAGQTNATIGGGKDCDATGVFATVGGGNFNHAKGPNSSIQGGLMAYAPLYGQVAHASGGFDTGGFYGRRDGIGTAQGSLFVLRNVTTGTNLTELFLDGAALRMTIPVGATWAFDMLMVARSSTGASSGWQVKGVIENVSGTTARIGSFTKTVLGEDVTAWALTIDADNSNDALSVKVTGANSTTIRWVASVRTSEVSF